MSVAVKKSGPGIKGLALSLKQLEKAEVLVGIPQSSAGRKNDPINNAQLMYILSKGSPLKNIPATPIIEPAIELNRKLITPHLAAAAAAMMDTESDGANQAALRELNLAGQIAANCVKRYFTEGNDWPPNKPSTIARKGSDKRNIDTGALRRAITYVVRVDGSNNTSNSESSEEPPESTISSTESTIPEVAEGGVEAVGVVAEGGAAAAESVGVVAEIALL